MGVRAMTARRKRCSRLRLWLIGVVALLVAAPLAAQEPAVPATAPPTAAPPKLESQTALVSNYVIEAEAQQVIDARENPALRLYGFADFGVTTMLRDGTRAIEGYFGASPRFAVGNLNVYLEADLADGFRSLAELRFTYLPNGAPDLSTGMRTSTLASDYTQFGQSVAWGGVVIERVFLEYEFHPLLTLRAGQWLTPVGVWNVDHGSPTIIPAMRPYVITANLFPLRQTGFEVYGSQLFGRSLTVGYNFTLSNGRGNVDSYLDFDHNKALGLRVYATSRALGKLTLGGSVYYGRSTTSNRIVATLSGGNAGLEADIASQYDELAYAGDLQWRLAELRVQVEVFGNQGVYTARGRPRAPVSEGNGLVPDFARWGGYALIAYSLPWLTLMPFIDLEYVADGNAVTAGPASSGRVYAASGGLNLRPGSSVVLKVQYYHGVVKNRGSSTQSFDTLAGTVAWSF
jgi:hypothetical protein